MISNKMIRNLDKYSKLDLFYYVKNFIHKTLTKDFIIWYTLIEMREKRINQKKNWKEKEKEIERGFNLMVYLWIIFIIYCVIEIIKVIKIGV